MIILKVTKNQSFTLYLEDTFFEKSHWRRQINPPAVLGLEKWQRRRHWGAGGASSPDSPSNKN